MKQTNILFDIRRQQKLLQMRKQRYMGEGGL